MVNITRNPVTPFSLSIPDKKITTALNRFDNGRHPTIKNGKITDSLPPYGVLVYRLQTAE